MELTKINLRDYKGTYVYHNEKVYDLRDAEAMEELRHATGKIHPVLVKAIVFDMEFFNTQLLEYLEEYYEVVTGEFAPDHIDYNSTQFMDFKLAFEKWYQSLGDSNYLFLADYNCSIKLEPFDLEKFLLAEATPKKFEHNVRNSFYYYDYLFKKWVGDTHAATCIAPVYFEELSLKVIETLNEYNVTPEEMMAAYKKLGWV